MQDGSYWQLPYGTVHGYSLITIYAGGGAGLKISFYIFESRHILRWKLEVCNPYIKLWFVNSNGILYGPVQVLGYGTVRYGTVRYGTVSHLLFLLIPGLILVVRANRLFYRFRTVFRLPYVIQPWYGTNHTSVQFFLLICCYVGVLAYGTVSVCAKSFLAILWMSATSIRNNPSAFFQNTYTIFVRKCINTVDNCEMSRYCRDIVVVPYRTVRNGAMRYFNIYSFS